MVWHPDMYDAPQTPSRHASKFSSPRLDWVGDSKGQVWWVLSGWKTCCIGWVPIFQFSEYGKGVTLKNCPHFLISPWVHHISLWSHPILVATPLQPLFVDHPLFSDLSFHSFNLFSPFLSACSPILFAPPLYKSSLSIFPLHPNAAPHLPQSPPPPQGAWCISMVRKAAMVVRYCLSKYI